MNTREFRDTSLYTSELGAPELRGEGKTASIRGYAAVFNQLTEDLFFGFRERIMPGAFTKAIRDKDDVRGLVNHNPSQLLGRTKSNTLRLREDERGLVYDIDPPDTQMARDLMVSMRRGDMDQSSFGFRVRGEEWKRENSKMVREVTDVELFDVSVVTYPAYKATSANVRSLFPDASSPDEVKTWVEERSKVLVTDAGHPTDPNATKRQHIFDLELRGLLQGISVERRDGQTLHNVFFDKTTWSVEAAKAWLEERGLTAAGLDETGEAYEFRQFDSIECIAGSYAPVSGQPGMRAVFCRRRA
jgi:HK97 family phage prohead protease